MRPLLTTSSNSTAFCISAASKPSSAGISSTSSAIRAATCIAVGITSLLDWLAFTSSFGCTGASPVEAACAITSLAFMLVDVPEPVWKMSSGKCAVEFARDDALGGAEDGGGLSVGEDAEVAVGLRGGGLHAPERLDEAAPEAQVGDGEIVLRALRLGAVEGAGGHLHVAEGVFFDAEVGHEESGVGPAATDEPAPGSRAALKCLCVRAAHAGGPRVKSA